VAFPPGQTLAHKPKDVATHVANDGMQEHLVNEMEKSHPRRMPGPPRVWLSPEGPRTGSPRSPSSPAARGSPMASGGREERGGSSRRRDRGASRAEPGIEARFLISGLKEEPHDSPHAAPLLLYDGAPEFDHALIKRD